MALKEIASLGSLRPYDLEQKMRQKYLLLALAEYTQLRPLVDVEGTLPSLVYLLHNKMTTLFDYDFYWDRGFISSLSLWCDVLPLLDGGLFIDVDVAESESRVVGKCVSRPHLERWIDEQELTFGFPTKLSSAAFRAGGVLRDNTLDEREVVNLARVHKARLEVSNGILQGSITEFLNTAVRPKHHMAINEEKLSYLTERVVQVGLLMQPLS